MKTRLMLCFVLLTACGEWPDAGGAPLSQNRGAWPVLHPISELVGTGALPTATSEDGNTLARRAEALRARARILRGFAGTPDAMEAMRARLP